MKLKKLWLSRAIALIASVTVVTSGLAIVSPVANAAVTTTTFEDGDTTYSFTGFGGAQATVVANAPAGFVGSKAAKITEGVGNWYETWAGVTILSTCGFEYLSSASKSITAKIYSADTGTVKMKIEDSSNGNNFVEKDITPSSANSWQNVTWDFTTPTNGAYSAGNNYNKMTIFFSFGAATASSYYLDSLAYELSATSEVCAITVSTPSNRITFDGGDTSGYNLTTYNGAKSSVVLSPGGAACPNNAMKLEKPLTAWDVYAGSTIISLTGDQSIVSTSQKIVTANVYSKNAGIVLTTTAMADDASTFMTKDVTLAAGWQTISVDFTSPTYTPNNTGYLSTKRYSILQMSLNGGSAPAGEVIYVDDIGFNGGGSPGITVNNYCPYVEPNPLGLIAAGGIEITKDAVKCTVGTYKTPATAAVFYLYLNGQVISGKTTAAKAGWMSDWDFVPMSYASASIAEGASWPLQKNWSEGRSSTVQCLVKAYANKGLDLTKTSVATIKKVGRWVKQDAITDITMRLVEPAMTKTSGVPSNYVDFSYDPIQNNWAQYYGPNLGVFYKYFEAGSTFKVTYKVTNTKTGKAIANRPVWLIVNKNYGGVQAASFTYSWNEEVSQAAGHSTDLGETQIPGWTDADGMVSFTLTNTNSATQAEPKPAKLYEVQPKSVTPLFSTITLTAHLGSDETHETKDIIWGHFTQK
jgi:hypothetical protein